MKESTTMMFPLLAAAAAGHCKTTATMATTMQQWQLGHQQ
jgi:predicted metal-dependent phosphotriesterase family hydrolase